MVFQDQDMLSIFDEEHSLWEERWVTLGMDHAGVPIVVCHTFREYGQHKALIRIISARRASKREFQQYQEI